MTQTRDSLLLIKAISLCFLLAVITLNLSSSKPKLISLLSGNINLINCMKISKDRELQCNFTKKKTVSQISSAEHLYLRQLYEEGNYDAILERIAIEEGMESCNLQPPVVSVHKRLQTYYAVVAYREKIGKFPQIIGTDGRLKCFVSSRFIWSQSENKRRMGDSERARILSALAYLLDEGWHGDSWQRGRTAYAQGELYRDAGDMMAAQQAFEIAVESFLNSDHERAVMWASRSWLALGDLARITKNYDGAIVGYRESIAQSPRFGARSFRRLVMVWQMQEREIGYILQQFEELNRKLNSHDPWLISGLVEALIDIEAIDEAWQLIRGAPQEVQNAAPVLNVQGAIYEAVGDLKQASLHYADALAQFLPTDSGEAASIARTLARVMRSQGNTDKELSYRELAVQLNPRSRWYWYDLGVLYEDLGEINKARNAFEQALALDPDNTTYKKRLDELGD